MSDLVGKITKVLLLLMMAITVFVALMFYIDTTGLPEGTATPTGWVSTFLQLAYIFSIVAAVIAVGFSLFKFVMTFIENPMKGLKSLIPFVAIGIVVIVSYSYAADHKLSIPAYEGLDNFDGSKVLKWSGAGLIGMYILSGLAILSIVFAEGAKILK